MTAGKDRHTGVNSLEKHPSYTYAHIEGFESPAPTKKRNRLLRTIAVEKFPKLVQGKNESSQRNKKRNLDGCSPG